MHLHALLLAALLAPLALQAPPASPGSTPPPASPGQAPPFDDGPGGADCEFCRALRNPPQAPGTPLGYAQRVELARAENQRAYEQDYLRRREALFEAHAGEWVVIAGGRLLPLDEHGKLRPAATREAADAAAEALAPGAEQRFVFRIGEDGDARYFPTLSSQSEWIGLQLLHRFEGTAWIAPDGVFVTPRGAEPGSGVRLGDGTLSESGPRAELELDTGEGTARQSIAFVASTGFEGYAVLGAARAAGLRLARWEIPGAVRLDSGDPPLRRARAHVVAPQGVLDAWLPVAVRPAAVAPRPHPHELVFPGPPTPR
ncbi:MAG: hypothetical protein H6828_13005 [Planctomycetes bacterium]|nr:hypothetical protein [Planctomycetota bacterium]